MIKALRGMKDALPPESEKYLFFLKEATQIVRRYGYRYIETPMLEETALFRRSVGESSDIVGKEMYQFTDKGNNDVCLRPEGTAGVVRSFIEHKLDRVGGIHRFFYYGPMFRYERPQKGRLRQFRQFGAESFGEESFYEDAAVIMMVRDILERFSISYTLKLNSLGCPECMPAYRTRLVTFLNDLDDGLCADCLRRKESNPIRVFDCKNDRCQELLRAAPRLEGALCAACDSHFNALRATLDRLNVPYEIDPNLVRGLDYYTRTAFEFVSDALGAQNAVAGGGRYDRLVSFLGGRPTPAIGFAIGVERILEMITMPEAPREGYYFGALCEEAVPPLFEIVQRRRSSDKVTMQYAPKSLKAHLKAADKAHARYCCILGEEELANQTLWIKDLENGTEERKGLG